MALPHTSGFIDGLAIFFGTDGKAPVAQGLMDVINLDQANARAAVLPREDGSELTRRQRGKDSRFLWIRKTETVRAELRGLGGIILPIVVRGEDSAVHVMQLQGRIGQDRIQTELGERW